MRVSILSFADTGGAGAACYRLYKGLGQSSRCLPTLIVRNKGKNDSTVRTAVAPRDTFTSLLKDGIKMLNRKAGGGAVPGIVRNIAGDSFAGRVLSVSRPELVNLHWLGDDFFPLNQVAKLKVPVVWTLHDMWTFTGGCHYSSSCSGFQNSCGNCPYHQKKPQKDRTRRDCIEKKRLLEASGHVFVAPSRWLASNAAQSSILNHSRIEVIPNAIDTDTFHPVNKSSARDVLGLPKDKKLLLFGASGGTNDPRKGYDLLERALNEISCNSGMKDVEMVVFGREFVKSGCRFPVHFLGEIVDEKMLTVVYSAADAMVIPSRHDNLPNTALESLSCGLPIIAFRVGGLTEIVKEQVNGFLCSEVTSDSLAEVILQVIQDDEILERLRPSSRDDAVTRYDLRVQADAYCELFEELNHSNHIKAKK